MLRRRGHIVPAADERSGCNAAARTASTGLSANRPTGEGGTAPREPLGGNVWRAGATAVAPAARLTATDETYEVRR